MNRYYASGLLAVTIGCAATAAPAAPLLSWDSTAAGGTAASDGSAASVGATAVDPGAQPSTLTRGSGAPGTPLQAFGNRGAFNTTNGFVQSSLANAEAQNDYYQFTAAPAAGNVLSLSGLSAEVYVQNTSTTASVALEYSLDGFATPGTVAATFTGISSGWTGGLQSTDLSGVAALQNVAGTVTFRFYGYGFPGYNDSGLGQVSGSNTDIELDGTSASAAIPEPAALGLLGAAGLMLLRTRRTR